MILTCDIVTEVRHGHFSEVAHSVVHYGFSRRPSCSVVPSVDALLPLLLLQTAGRLHLGLTSAVQSCCCCCTFQLPPPPLAAAAVRHRTVCCHSVSVSFPSCLCLLTTTYSNHPNSEAACLLRSVRHIPNALRKEYSEETSPQCLISATWQLLPFRRELVSRY